MECEWYGYERLYAFIRCIHIYCCDLSMHKQLNVLITGTSKGLGFDLVSIFLQAQPNSIIYATSRDTSQQSQQRWNSIDTSSRVRTRQLEMCSNQSIDQFINNIRQEKILFDLLVNNAGVTGHEAQNQIPDIETARKVISTNLLGVMRLTKQMLPFLSEKGRVINVSSRMGALELQPEETFKRLSRIDLTESDIHQAACQYLKQVVDRKMKNWSSNSYAASKVLLNACSRFVFQKQWLKGDQLSLCVSPGFCKTPMTAKFPQDKHGQMYSCYSGALRIYQTSVEQKVTSEVFYHRNRVSDYQGCGKELPVDNDPSKE